MIFDSSAIHKNEKLKYKIAVSFGFNDYESGDLVTQAGLYANTHYANHENRFGARISLSKIIVHKCIFRISNKVFSQNPVDKRRLKILGYYPDFGSPHASNNYGDIPLSVRVVYILNSTIGFTEFEIAEILNITSSQVRERFNKATSY